jgi:hypothetical protein
MHSPIAATLLAAFLLPACQPEPSTSPDGVPTVELAATEVPSVQEVPANAHPNPFPTASTPAPAGVPELTENGIGPVKLGMTYAELIWAKLEPEFIDGGVAVGPVRAGFAPARGGPIVSVHVTLGELPEGIKIGDKILKNESTSLQELADAVGSCDPIAPNIGSAETTCHGGRVILRGAGPIGGKLSITLKSV